MSEKLQNIKAVHQLIDGTHSTQTRRTYGFSTTTQEKRRPGDVWTEQSPQGTIYEITQHDGYRTKRLKNSVTVQVNEILKVPTCCPKCGTHMRNHEKRLNFKFWFKRKQCFSCVLKEEQEIKNQGPDAWLRYEQRIMLENAESWFKDADKEVEVLKQQVYETYWQNADGERGEINISEYIKKIEEDYESLKTNIRNQFGNEQ
jgi:hypothetical protein